MKSNQLRSVIATTMLLGCAGAPTKPANTPLTSQKPRGYLHLEVSASGEEKSKLDDVIATVDGLLASTGFWNNFALVAAKYPAIYVGPEYKQEGMTPGSADAQGAASFLRNPGSQYHTFAAVVGLTGTYYKQGDDYTGTCTNPAGESTSCRATKYTQNYSNMFVGTGGIGKNLPSSRELVSIDIGREVFDRYNGSTISKSCTYNTLAHEWTHTIGKNQPEHWAITVDTADKSIPSSVPLLPYLLGSVIQCSWLQNQGALQNKDLSSCVEMFGVTKFNSLLCK